MNQKIKKYLSLFSKYLPAHSLFWELNIESKRKKKKSKLAAFDFYQSEHLSTPNFYKPISTIFSKRRYLK